MVLVLVEHDGGEVDELSLQALALARELATGEPVSALLVGAGGREAAAPLAAHGVGTAHVAEDERLAEIRPGGVGHERDRAGGSARAERGRRRGNEPRQRGSGSCRGPHGPAVRGQLHPGRRRGDPGGDPRALGREPARGGATPRRAGAALGRAAHGRGGGRGRGRRTRDRGVHAHPRRCRPAGAGGGAREHGHHRGIARRGQGRRQRRPGRRLGRGTSGFSRSWRSCSALPSAAPGS